MIKQVFEKTDKGREEIATRKYHLSARLRSLLVMIDGNTPTDDLLKKATVLGMDEKHINELLEGEYIRESVTMS